MPPKRSACAATAAIARVLVREVGHEALSAELGCRRGQLLRPSGDERQLVPLVAEHVRERKPDTG